MCNHSCTGRPCIYVPGLYYFSTDLTVPPHIISPFFTSTTGADIMTKSLGGLALAASTVISGGGGIMNHSTMAGKTAENGSSGSAGGGAGGAGNNGMVDMSKSLASFHLSSSATTAGGGSSGIGSNGANGNNQTSNSTRNRAMDESVDHLFKEGKTLCT